MIRELKMEEIQPNKYQPREDIKEDNIEELAKSIEENGIIQPIIVRRSKEGYEIVAGERRFRAVERLGLKKIPAIIRDMEDDQSAKIALIENIQREDLNIVEEGRAFKKILNEFGLTQEKLSKEIGKSRSYISNTVRLLELSEEILDLIINKEISVGHGKVLLGVKDLEKQKEYASKIVSGNLTVRQTENLLKEQNNSESVNIVKKDDHLRSLENDLMMSLGTRVNLVHGKDKGVIQIEYYGEEDLDRILDLIK